jgi:hypothetical protein
MILANSQRFSSQTFIRAKTPHLSVFALLVVTAYIVGCSEQTPEFDSDASVATPDSGIPGDAYVSVDAGTAEVGTAQPELHPAWDRFVSESLGVGSAWYLYESTTHVLTPRPETYLIRLQDVAAEIDVLSYYDVRGESGYFALRHRFWNNGVWDAPETVEFSQNVKTTPLCLDRNLQPSDCGPQNTLLVLRADSRVIPAAGFTVAEPGIYLHPSGEDVIGIWKIPGEFGNSLDPAALSVHGALQPHARLLAENAAFSDLIGEDTEPATVLQATTSMHLAWWNLAEWNEGGDTLELTLNVRCGSLEMSAETQEIPDASSQTTTTLQIPVVESGSTFIALCGDEGTRITETVEGQVVVWPSSRSFDLWVEFVQGVPSLLASPGARVRIFESDSADAPFATTPEIGPTLWL